MNGADTYENLKGVLFCFVIIINLSNICALKIGQALQDIKSTISSSIIIINCDMLKQKEWLKVRDVDGGKLGKHRKASWEDQQQ